MKSKESGLKEALSPGGIRGYDKNRNYKSAEEEKKMALNSRSHETDKPELWSHVKNTKQALRTQRN